MRQLKKSTAIYLALVLMLGLSLVACDSPKEQATEERLEDSGMSEERAEDISEGDTAATSTTVTDTSMTTGTYTDTSATTMTTGTTTTP